MFKGVYTAIVTPFREDTGLDLESLDRLIEFQIENGIDGIVPVGTTGESPTLSMDEHIDVARNFAGSVYPDRQANWDIKFTVQREGAWASKFPQVFTGWTEMGFPVPVAVAGIFLVPGGIQRTMEVIPPRL